MPKRINFYRMDNHPNLLLQESEEDIANINEIDQY
jgi:hypothetical protein